MGWFDKKPNGREEGKTDPRPPDAVHPPEPTRAAEPRRTETTLPQPTQEPAPMSTPPAASQPPGQEPETPRGLAALFGSRPADQPSHPSAAMLAATDGGSVFAESVEIEGSLEGEGDVILRGQVRGSISITGTLMVAETGRVLADVAAREVVCGGTVEGNIRATDKVRVQGTGLVQGDIDSPSIVIDDGGGVEGFVQMEPPGGDDVDDAPAPAAPPPAAGRLGRAAVRTSDGPGVAATSQPSVDQPQRLTREMLLGLQVSGAPPAAGLLNRPASAPAAQPRASTGAGEISLEGNGNGNGSGSHGPTDGPGALDASPLADVLGGDDLIIAPDEDADVAGRPLA